MRTETAAIAGLRRHQLAYLTARGWSAAMDSVGARDAAVPLRAWALRGLPLVVARQPPERRAGRVVLAWTSPAPAGRERVAVEVPLRSIAYFHEFPAARAAIGLLPRTARTAVRVLLDDLQTLGIGARAYGSYGWQALSGEPYVRARSDLDLWLPVANHGQAGAAVRALAKADAASSVRIDGELLFPEGAGVAWREYAAWREGRVRALLVKRIDSVQVTQALDLPAWCESAAA